MLSVQDINLLNTVSSIICRLNGYKEKKLRCYQRFKRQNYRAINEIRKKELKSQLVFFVASLPGEESIQQLDELS